MSISNLNQSIRLNFSGRAAGNSDLGNTPNYFRKGLSERQLFVVEMLIAAVFCFSPLLYNNPYRLNIFLSWEGAYRIYLGQMPFKEYALPMGYGYWLIPAMFFKIFGPFMYSLIKAQVFINLVSILAFRSILKLFNVTPVTILLSVLVFCLSYVSKNFWPWYNHTVIVYELVALYFVLLPVLKTSGWKTVASLGFSALCVFLSIFTKQDAGALTLLICLAILTYDTLIEKSPRKLLTFLGFFTATCIAFIAPIWQYDFTYWFNYGQAPHDSRLVLHDFFNHIVGWAYFEKFFLFVTVIMILDKARKGRAFFENKTQFLFAFFTLAILIEALIIQVTSDEPPYGEDFFYAFGFVFCFSHLRFSIDLSRWYYLATCLVFVTFWWTGIYWRNIQRVIAKKPVAVAKVEKEAPHKYRLAKEFKTMDKLYLAESTIEGIKRIQALDVVKNKKDIKVLNMSELTSLAYEMPFTPLTNQPMWFHQGVSIFQKEVDEFCVKVRNNEYDLVLFESIPTNEVINFYPEDVNTCLKENYNLEFSFLAPRTPAESYIHVYTKKK
ncbi:hypothetical protein [Chryseosolibacter indicus]|uniref:Dolichyl-phosphate-mannose-protein mannosyltransferase n=1 Tax=Chryseosolibacter indicus TaxID=2782351 RepID=A0ABS5VMB2_9BACT|nr:hypothetical protein [Chryseosolibacter indicus]MBT1702587.1 hypothetical protein [Chryseosolibacter indicus]